ncbi:hypothetical protein ACFQS1_37020 [Paractinoplanes rhizophilus]|uniref:Uncharacterized protein n=1 Tax=Paractinoplanes rhizophilus TaxID=1416877 RepID=A0ABW2I3Y6_9ACTN
MTTEPDLIDRPVSFAYNYRMRCGCGGVEDLSAVDYEAEINDAHIPCSRCGGSIHFGRGVAALRDLNDPALENEQLSRLAWYHTSTSPDWPSLTNEEQQRERLRDFRLVTDEQIARLSDLALHVGTYEAAIENVLRRMKYQNDRDSRFFLYRVALNLDPTQVETDYRDENEQRAARLTNAELRDEGLHAVRYLNVYESPGSLSLAVTAGAIAAVQMVDLDGHGLVPDHDAELTERLGSFQRDLDADRQRPLPPPREPILALEQLQRRAAPRRGRAADSGRSTGPEFYRLWESIDSVLAERYLVGVNAIVAREFRDAVRPQRRDDDGAVRAYADFYATRAFALTHPSALIADLASRPAAALRARPAEIDR